MILFQRKSYKSLFKRGRGFILITLALLIFVFSNRNFNENSIINRQGLNIEPLKTETLNSVSITNNVNLTECVRDNSLLSKLKFKLFHCV